MEAGNRYLEEAFLPQWNERFARVAAHQTDAHRPIGPRQELASVFAHVETRRVDNDYTVPWNRSKWQIPKAAIGPGLRRSSIRVEEHLDGKMVAQINGKPIQLAPCDELTRPLAKPRKRPGKRFVPAPGQSRWMDGFHVEGTAARKAVDA